MSPTHLPHRWAVLLVFSLFFVAAGCDTAEPEPIGLDFDRLFAPATQAEINAARAEWDTRAAGGAYTPGDVRVEYDDDLLNDGGRVVILSHTTGDSPERHYGAVRVPPGAGPFAVLVVNHGGDRGFNLTNDLNFFAHPDASPFGVVGNAVVTVFPTFRSETMRGTPLGDLTSGGDPSPWDRDVDDAFALLSAVLAPDVIPEADPDRVGTLGFSRGGAVSLLMAQRPLPAGTVYAFDAVAAFFPPTDFLSPSFRQLAETLVGSPGSPAEGLPGALFFRDQLLLPIDRGEITHEEARLAVIGRSPVHFVDRLPATQVHHHRRDAVVPFAQFELLQAEEARFGSEVEFYAYGEAGTVRPEFHNPAEMPQSIERTTRFLFEHLVQPVPAE